MSNLENLSDDQLGNLIKLSRHLFSKRASDVVYTSLIDIIENEQLGLLDEIGKYFGVKEMYLDDYTFIVELNSLNEDYVKGDSIIRPTLVNYEIFEYEFEWQKVRNRYSNDISSYTEITEELLDKLRDSDMYSTYDGGIIDSDTYDSEWIESGVERIVKLK